MCRKGVWIQSRGEVSLSVKFLQLDVAIRIYTNNNNHGVFYSVCNTSNKFGAATKFNARILITEERVKNKSYCSPYRIVNDVMHSFDHTCQVSLEH